MLPLSECLSASERKEWVHKWRRLVWGSRRHVSTFVAVAATCLAFFSLFMPPWEFTPQPLSCYVFGLGELVAAYALAEFVTFGLSRNEIERRISAGLRDRNGR